MLYFLCLLTLLVFGSDLILDLTWKIILHHVIHLTFHQQTKSETYA